MFIIKVRREGGGVEEGERLRDRQFRKKAKFCGKETTRGMQKLAGI